MWSTLKVFMLEDLLLHHEQYNFFNNNSAKYDPS